MNEEAALMRFILDDPNDDGARLVFADWLDENGRSDRAAFVRMQVQLTALPWEDNRRQVLELRAHRLLDLHRKAWERELPPWARGRVIFHRGFVEEVSVAADCWLADAAGLLAVAPIQSLHLKDAGQRLADLGRQSSLARIRSLNLFENRVGPAGIAALVQSPHLHAMTTLYLTGNSIGREGASDLARRSNAFRLVGLGVRQNGLNDDGGIVLAGGPWGQLRWLNLSDNGVGDATMRALAESEEFDQLIALDVASNLIEPAGIAALTRSRWEKLNDLNLSANFIGDEGAVTLAAWVRPKPWAALRLWSNGIGDLGATALAGSLNLTTIRSLDLSGNGVGDAGAIALANSLALDEVRKLDLRENPIGDDGRRALRQRFGDRVTV